MSSLAPAPNLVSLVRVGTRGVLLLPAEVQSRSPPDHITSRSAGRVDWMDGWMAVAASGSGEILREIRDLETCARPVLVGWVR